MTARDDEEGPEKGVKLTRSLQEFRDLKARVGELPPVTPEEVQDREHEKLVVKQLELLRARDEAKELRRVEDLQEELDEIDLKEAILLGPAIDSITDLPFLVRGRIHEVGLTQLAAQWYQGKSLLAVSLAMAVSNGWDEWLGYPIDRHGLVIYVAAEASPVVQIAVKAWMAKYGGHRDRLAILTERFPNDFTVDAATDVMDQAVAYVQEGLGTDEEPVLVIGDTQIDMVGNAEENSIELGRAIRRMRQWAVSRELAFLLVHHAGHEGERGRGHSSQLAKADSLMFIHPHEKDDSLKKLQWQKVKGVQKPDKEDELHIVAVPGTGGAVIELPTAGVLISKAAKTDWDLRARIWEAVGQIVKAGDPALKNRIIGKIGGKRERVMDEIDLMIEDEQLTVVGKVNGLYPHVDQGVRPEDLGSKGASWADLASEGVDPETGDGEERE